jgi:hypothetical protein
MEETKATGVLFLMFALRCIAPLVLTLGIGYLMNRLVSRWEAEEAETAAEPQDLPVLEPGSTSGARLPTINVPCWILRNCDEAAMADCAARKQPSIPCWLARLRAEGSLPEGCPDCPIYEDAVPAPAV